MASFPVLEIQATASQYKDGAQRAESQSFESLSTQRSGGAGRGQSSSQVKRQRGLIAVMHVPLLLIYSPLCKVPFLNTISLK